MIVDRMSSWDTGWIGESLQYRFQTARILSCVICTEVLAVLIGCLLT